MMSVRGQFVQNRSLSAGKPAEGCEDYITKDEVARRLKKTPRTVENWQRSGKIPFLKVGASVLYRWSDVQECLERKFRVMREPSQRSEGGGRRSEGNGQGSAEFSQN